MFYKIKKKRYYREWLSSWGWGVMLSFDTVMAKNKKEASEPVGGMYAYDQSFETIKKVEKKHLHLSDYELSKIYGYKE